MYRCIYNIYVYLDTLFAHCCHFSQITVDALYLHNNTSTSNTKHLARMSKQYGRGPANEVCTCPQKPQRQQQRHQNQAVDLLFHTGHWSG